MVAPELAVVAFLLNALWQAPLLAALGALIAMLMRSAPAAYRHRLWVATLVFAVLAPLSSVVAPAAGPSPALPLRSVGASKAPRPSDVALGLTAKHLEMNLVPAARTVSGLIAILYVSLVLVRAARLCASWRRTSMLVARAVAPSSVVEACLSRLGGRAPVRVSDEVAVPMTFGISAPVVVVPSSLAEPGSPDLPGILAHELAHVLRRDCAVNLLCEMLSVPLWFHPAVQFMKRRIGGAREAACDEAAAAWVGSRAYARTLFEVAARACSPTRLSGALSVLDGDSLEERMKLILEGRAAMSARLAMALLITGVVGLGLLARQASQAGVVLAAEAGPDDMKGQWTGTLSGGPRSGQPAADLAIRLTPQGPDVTLTLYRYDQGADLKAPGTKETLPAVQHSVVGGVLRFRTRFESFRIRPDDVPGPSDADWQFAVVGKDAGELTLLKNSRLEADKAKGIDVPPPPGPLPMTRSSRE